MTQRLSPLFGALRRRGRRLAWPLGIVAVIAFLFLQGRGENLALSPPPLGGPTERAEQEPSAAGTPAEPEPPEVVEIEGQQIKTRGAFILLNPAMAAPGSTVGLTGTGFDPGARVNLTLKRNETDRGQQLNHVLADKGGNLGGVNVTIPEEWNGGSFLLVASQHDGKRQSQVTGQIQPMAPQVKLADQVGAPGTPMELSVKGFAPEEEVGVYLNSLNTEPATTFKVDKSGSLGQGSIRIPFGAVGNQSLIFYGTKSQAPAVVPFTMLSLYPTAEVDQYAIKADNALTISAEGFGPKEGVRVHLNGTDTPPIALGETGDQGTLRTPVRFKVPFALKGKQTLVLVGEKSQAVVVAGFEVLPYTPTVEPSTYGGRPGTVVTFYGSGFARSEIVQVRVGKTHDNPGREVSCFKTDDKGTVNGGGAYTIPANVQGGTLTFSFVGAKSEGQASASIEVTPAPDPSQVPAAPTEPFVCTLDQPPAGAPGTGQAEPGQAGEGQASEPQPGANAG